MVYDDWHTETQARLAKSNIFTVLKEKCESDSSGSQVLALIDDATFYAFQRTKTILKHMGEFTLHDGDHLFRVLALMERLLSPEQINLHSGSDQANLLNLLRFNSNNTCFLALKQLFRYSKEH